MLSVASCTNNLIHLLGRRCVLFYQTFKGSLPQTQKHSPPLLSSRVRFWRYQLWRFLPSLHHSGTRCYFICGAQIAKKYIWIFDSNMNCLFKLDLLQLTNSNVLLLQQLSKAQHFCSRKGECHFLIKHWLSC